MQQGTHYMAFCVIAQPHENRGPSNSVQQSVQKSISTAILRGP